MEQLTFSSRARTHDPATSKQAADSLTPEILGKQCRLVLSVIGDGATAAEITERLQRGGHRTQQNCVARRLTDLREAGLVEDSGSTRPGWSGRHQIVWTKR